MIEIKNLTFAYTGREKPTIRNINLSVKPGDFAVLCGPTGCGKSTLLRQLKPAVKTCISQLTDSKQSRP